jgi:hypothetical protein
MKKKVFFMSCKTLDHREPEEKHPSSLDNNSRARRITVAQDSYGGSKETIKPEATQAF